uniref:Uncharacterized protein n=1 Tax=Alexandrium monilatum TaxID=311494 RepID=A0A7S4UK27_9DINO
MVAYPEAYSEAYTEVLLRQRAEVADLEDRLGEVRKGLAAPPAALGEPIEAGPGEVWSGPDAPPTAFGEYMKARLGEAQSRLGAPATAFGEPAQARLGEVRQGLAAPPPAWGELIEAGPGEARGGPEAPPTAFGEYMEARLGEAQSRLGAPDTAFGEPAQARLGYVRNGPAAPPTAFGEYMEAPLHGARGRLVASPPALGEPVQAQVGEVWSGPAFGEPIKAQSGLDAPPAAVGTPAQAQLGKPQSRFGAPPAAVGEPAQARLGEVSGAPAAFGEPVQARLDEVQSGIRASPMAIRESMQAANSVCRVSGYPEPYYFHPVPTIDCVVSGVPGSYKTGVLPPQPGSRAGQPLAWPRPPPTGLKASPDNVLVERRRTLGEREFKLWVEDLLVRGGIRVCAMDTASFAQIQTDVSDAEVQSMFNQYWWRLSRKRSGDHCEQLTEFLGALLDSAYLELGAEDLELRIPEAVHPPLQSARTVDAFGCNWMYTVSKGWIRDNILQGRPSSALRRVPCRPQRRQTAGEVRRPSRPQSACSSGRPPRSRPQSAREDACGRPEFYTWEPLASTARSHSSRPGSAEVARAAPSPPAGAGASPADLESTRKPPPKDTGGYVIIAAPMRPASARGPRRRVTSDSTASPPLGNEEVFERLHTAHTVASIARLPVRTAAGGW